MDHHHAPYPVKPTLVPQARRYTRTFNAAAGKVFTEDDQITIEIPPINHTYLTKDARIYFKFDMSFYDHSFTSTAGLPSNWFNATKMSPLNALRKPVPMLDVCGPYGFFRDVEVYDYLGNTLLEKTIRHDLLACTMADFYLDSEVERLRPPISENQKFTVLAKTTPAGTAIENYGTDRSFGSPGIHTRVNGINLLDIERNGFLNVSDDYVPTSGVVFDEYVQTPPTPTSTLVQIPTWGFSIQLLNFLGRGSSSFVPLHNGYRIVLKLNKKDIPVKFSLPNGGLKVNIANTAGFVTLQPLIKDFNFHNVFLRADLLEISPQMDEQVDKVVRSRMNSYVTLGRCDKPTIVPGNFLSVNQFRISMRHLPASGSVSASELGFRSRTYVKSARLLYNGAVQQEYKSVDQIRNALGPEFDPLITTTAFAEDVPMENKYGTAGYMYPYMSHDFKYDVAAIPTLDANYIWVSQNTDPSLDSYNAFYGRFNNQAGKFLIQFDLSLNGYNQNTITGIDTSKTTITLDLQRSKTHHEAYETDVFIDHDAIITVSPGKHTSVSF